MFDVDMISTVFESIDIDTAYFILDVINPDIAFIISRIKNVSIATVMILFFLLGMIPFANIIVRVVFGAKLAEAFGKNEVFGAVLSYFPFLFYIILGFGKSTYFVQKNQIEKNEDFWQISI